MLLRLEWCASLYRYLRKHPSKLLPMPNNGYLQRVYTVIYPNGCRNKALLPFEWL